jgi:hypothetical protein
MSAWLAKRMRLPGLPVWIQEKHPIFWLESRRYSRNRALRVLKASFVPILFGLTLVAMVVTGGVMLPLQGWWNIDSGILGALGLVIAVLILIQIGAGATFNILVVSQTSPLISGEIELQSWRLLRTTTLPLRDIVLAKYFSALRQMWVMLAGLMIVRLISAGTIMLFIVYTFVRQTIYYWDVSQWKMFFEGYWWIACTAGVSIAALCYIAQPVVQLFLNGALGMLASALMRSRSGAIAAGLIARLVGWIGMGMLNALAINLLGTLYNSWINPQYAVLEAFRGGAVPSATAQAWATSLGAAGYILAIVMIQMGVTLIALGIVQRRARQLGV